jgi:hypothetical protein
MQLAASQRSWLIGWILRSGGQICRHRHWKHSKLPLVNGVSRTAGRAATESPVSLSVEHVSSRHSSPLILTLAWHIPATLNCEIMAPDFHSGPRLQLHDTGVGGPALGSPLPAPGILVPPPQSHHHSCMACRGILTPEYRYPILSTADNEVGNLKPNSTLSHVPTRTLSPGD